MRSTIHLPSFSHGLRLGRPMRIWSMLLTAYQVWTERRTLQQLDDALLRDMGLTRAAAEHEASRPPWDAPHRFLY